MSRTTMRKKLSISIEKSLIKSIDLLVKTGIYRNKSHVVEFSLNKLLKEKKDAA